MSHVTTPQIIGTGLITLDIVISPEIDAPLKAWTGGTCGNVLTILAYLGWRATPLARINGDFASRRVIADMKRWGVDLDFINCPPTTNTPIIIQEIRKIEGRAPSHHFIWKCPHCGHALPFFKPITKAVLPLIEPELKNCVVFFMDRLSRAALDIASKVKENGGVIFFEPSGKGDPKLFGEALQLAHVVKYSDQRFPETLKIPANNILEIQTLGEKGLRWRHQLAKQKSNWMHEAIVNAPIITDSCGSGDWCSAGIIKKICYGGIEQLKGCDEKELKDGIKYGQALAAWNCGFEGARGGMYALPQKEDFNSAIEKLILGDYLPPVSSDMQFSESVPQIFCPLCEHSVPNFYLH